MKTSYSPDFERFYRGLRPSTRAIFRELDTKLRQTGDLSVLEQHSQVHFVKLDDCCTALGRLRNNGELYWLLISTTATKPAIS